MSRSRSPRASRHAAVLVDYANLHALLAERLDAPDQARTHIAEALGKLRRYLTDEDGTAPILTTAYANFDALGEGSELQQTLYRQGVEPRFVPAGAESSAVEVQLAVNATALVHRRPAVETVALVTGDRTYLPLVQALRREGVHVTVVALDPPPPGEHTPADGGVFMDFLNLLSDKARRELLQSGEMPTRQGDGTDERSTTPAADRYDRLDDDMLFRTLEVAEEHFGQYDEIYLTPLLRKLSDVLGERFDPKALVSDLEDAGAVRLEKRRGYPYDYTVLIVERTHPDVQQMEEDFYDGSRSRYERGGASHDGSPSSAGDGYGKASGADDTDHAPYDGAPAPEDEEDVTATADYDDGESY